MSEAGVILEHRAAPWIVSVLTIALLALGNLPWQLEDYDQAKQAFTSWQMVKSHRFLYQETPNGKVATKPPLVGLVSAALYKLTRSWDVAWRLPSFAAALVLAWILWRGGAALAGPLGGLIALAAFALNLLTPRLATLVRTDMPLALVSFGIALLFFDQIRVRERWQPKERAALCLLLTAAMLIKGPIVYAFVLPAIVFFAWRYRKNPVALRVATGWWPWIVSLTIFIAWVVVGIKTVPGFYDEVVLREFVGRFGETFHRPQPIYFYLPHLLHKWAPWSLLLIALTIAEVRAASLRPGTAAATTSGLRRWFADLRPENFWLLAWSIGGLLVMSCIPSKRVDRIFPVVPPLCLLLAAMSASRSLPPDRMRRWCAVTLAAAAIFASSYTIFKISEGVRGHRDALAKCGREWRARAAREHLRYAVLRGDKEALVIYLDVPSFINENDAVERWKASELDALIGPEESINELLPELAPAGHLAQSEFCSGIKAKEPYIVLNRQ